MLLVSSHLEEFRWYHASGYKLAIAISQRNKVRLKERLENDIHEFSE
jgi:hypothetical protein